jgi:hypothetical protein
MGSPELIATPGLSTYVDAAVLGARLGSPPCALWWAQGAIKGHMGRLQEVGSGMGREAGAPNARCVAGG